MLSSCLRTARESAIPQLPSWKESPPNVPESQERATNAALRAKNVMDSNLPVLLAQERQEDVPTRQVPRREAFSLDTSALLN
jgi:hypothetical protein